MLGGTRFMHFGVIVSEGGENKKALCGFSIGINRKEIKLKISIAFLFHLCLQC
jgi:hypothetical protein